MSIDKTVQPCTWSLHVINHWNLDWGKNVESGWLVLYDLMFTARCVRNFWRYTGSISPRKYRGWNAITCNWPIEARVEREFKTSANGLQGIMSREDVANFYCIWLWRSTEHPCIHAWTQQRKYIQEPSDKESEKDWRKTRKSRAKRITISRHNTCINFEQNEDGTFVLPKKKG